MENSDKKIEIPNQYSSLVFMCPISWSKVFDKWREGEANQESWKRHWEERGFDSWDEWRTAYVAPLQPESLQWYLYKINYPLKNLPLIFGVPTDAWIKKAYNGQKIKKLQTILEIPIIKENDKIQAIKKDFPKKTMLTGLVCDDKIVLVEGMHRACAMAGWDPKIPFNSDVTIALALWEKEIPKIGGNYKNK